MAYVVLDETKKIIKYNHEARELLNLTPYRNFFIYTFLNGKTSISSFIQNIENEKIKTFEMQILDTNKQAVSLEVSKSKTIIDGKKRVLLSLKDITASKKDTEIKIEKAKIQSLNEMAQKLAHQWRQPLNLISLSAGGLEMNESFKDEESKRLINNIINSTSSLSETINIFSRALEKNTKPHTNIKLFNVISEAIMFTSKIVNEHKIKLTNNTESIDKSDKININTEDFSDILTSIIFNSVDAITLNNIQKPWIKIDVNTLDDNILIIIEDNGGGIKDNILPNIFEPYTTTKHEAQGTGLSLYLAYEIVNEVLNGSIYAENTKDGAKLTINLPIIY